MVVLPFGALPRFPGLGSIRFQYDSGRELSTHLFITVPIAGCSNVKWARNVANDAGLKICKMDYKMDIGRLRKTFAPSFILFFVIEPRGCGKTRRAHSHIQIPECFGNRSGL